MAERTELTSAGERVLAAAAELFYRDGINSVGVAGIAERAGVTKKTLYDCFGSKSALVAAYLRARHEQWWRYLEGRLEAAEGPKALVVFDTYLEHPWIELGRGCSFLNAAAELPAEHEGMAVVREHKLAVEGLLARLLREERMEDPETLAAHLFLLLEGAVAHSRLDGGTGKLKQARELAISLLQRDPSSHVLR